MKPPLSTSDIELAVVKHLNVRRNLIVPNVSWAIPWMQGREADLLVVTPTRSLWEIEIKTNLPDVRRERKKTHRLSQDKRIARLYYAMPRSLVESALPIIAKWAGVLAIHEEFHTVKVHRPAAVARSEFKLSDKTLNRLRDLCMMRMWSLKRSVQDLCKVNESLRAAQSVKSVQSVSPIPSQAA